MVLHSLHQRHACFDFLYGIYTRICLNDSGAISRIKIDSFVSWVDTKYENNGAECTAYLLLHA